MNGKLTLDFKGNRVDVIAGDGDPVDLDVRIDGRPPSQRPESYYFTRANGFDNLPNPLLLRARSTVLPVDGESWTIRLTDMKADGGRFKFRVSGSVSGADGEGDSQFEFVSKSGRLAILPEDWNVAWCAGLLGAPVPGEVTVQIEGHTDERGGREYNLALGQKRAEAVQRALVLMGVPESQVEAVSYGKEKPAAQGADEAAFAKNRRVELKY